MSETPLCGDLQMDGTSCSPVSAASQIALAVLVPHVLSPSFSKTLESCQGRSRHCRRAQEQELGLPHAYLNFIALSGVLKYPYLLVPRLNLSSVVLRLYPGQPPKTDIGTCSLQNRSPQ
jgi:hypothetical protein